MLHPKNLKFTPKHFFNNDSLKTLLQKSSMLNTIHSFLNLDYNNYNECNFSNNNFWIKFADKATNSIFNDLVVFCELCEVMY